MEAVLRRDRTLLFTLAIASLMTVASLGGLVLGNLYSQETPAWYVQCIGQDIIDLVVVVPTLLLSALVMRKGSRPAFFVWLGATLYTIYTFLIYCFAVHFNAFFLVYCAVLGLAVYATTATVVAIDLSVLRSWFDEKKSGRPASTFLFALAVLFGLLWLKEIIPAIFQNEVPQAIKETGLPTNPVHVLDLSMVLPGFIIAAILLKRKHPFGYLFAPAFLVFATLMDVTIGALVLMMKLRGMEAEYAMIGVFALLALATILILVDLVKPATRSSVS
jgi:hypothetical protein